MLADRGAALRTRRRRLLPPLGGSGIRLRLPAGRRQQMIKLSAERGGDPGRPGKKDPLDPLVWLARRPGEPSWDSRFGPGRPGWHVECAAIATRYLGTAFDVQAGGSDLIFPHHEMSASHARVALRRGRRRGVRAPVRARRDGAARRREDVQVAGQPGVRLRAAAVGHRSDGDQAGDPRAPLPDRLGLDRRGTDGSVRAAGSLARGRSGRFRRSGRRGGRTGLRPARVRRARRPAARACWRPSASGSPTTWTLLARWRASTSGPTRRWPGPASVTRRGRRRRRGSSGMPSTRCLASSCSGRGRQRSSAAAARRQRSSGARPLWRRTAVIHTPLFADGPRLAAPPAWSHDELATSRLPRSALRRLDPPLATAPAPPR